MKKEQLLEEMGKAILKMLENKFLEVCANCPKNYLSDDAKYYINLHEINVCHLCEQFMGIPKDGGDCPCGELGPVEAPKRAWLTLEEKGII